MHPTLKGERTARPPIEHLTEYYGLSKQEIEHRETNIMNQEL